MGYLRALGTPQIRFQSGPITPVTPYELPPLMPPEEDAMSEDGSTNAMADPNLDEPVQGPVLPATVPMRPMDPEDIVYHVSSMPDFGTNGPPGQNTYIYDPLTTGVMTPQMMLPYFHDVGGGKGPGKGRDRSGIGVPVIFSPPQNTINPGSRATYQQSP